MEKEICNIQTDGQFYSSFDLNIDVVINPETRLIEAIVDKAEEGCSISAAIQALKSEYLDKNFDEVKDKLIEDAQKIADMTEESEQVCEELEERGYDYLKVIYFDNNLYDAFDSPELFGMDYAKSFLAIPYDLMQCIDCEMLGETIIEDQEKYFGKGVEIIQLNNDEVYVIYTQNWTKE